MAKIGCFKPFRGSYNNMKDIVLEDGEIAFTTDNKRIYMGNGSDSISGLDPFINAGSTIHYSLNIGEVIPFSDTALLAALKNTLLNNQVISYESDIGSFHGGDGNYVFKGIWSKIPSSEWLWFMVFPSANRLIQYNGFIQLSNSAGWDFIRSIIL